MSPTEARSRLLTPTLHLAAEGLDTQRRLNSISIAAWRSPGSHVLTAGPTRAATLDGET